MGEGKRGVDVARAPRPSGPDPRPGACPLNRLLGAGGAGLRNLLKKDSVRPEEVWPQVRAMLSMAPGSLGHFIRSGGGALGAREPGVAHAMIFPLPWIPRPAAQQKMMLGQL